MLIIKCTVKPDDTTVQLIFEHYYVPKYVEVSNWDAFMEHDNKRRLGGLSSTAK